MPNTAVFYHAGCPVCLSAEQDVMSMVDKSKYAVEIVHLAQAPEKFDDAAKAGVQSVPALVLTGNVLHINFGASLKEVRKAVTGCCGGGCH